LTASGSKLWITEPTIVVPFRRRFWLEPMPSSALARAPVQVVVAAALAGRRVDSSRGLFTMTERFDYDDAFNFAQLHAWHERTIK
jgi:hypothetical protein